MKKQLLNSLICCLLAVPFVGTKAQSTADAGQSTEGTEFWLTFPRADESDSKEAKPFLAISAKKAGDNTIHVINTALGLDSVIIMTAADNRYKEIEIPAKYCYLTKGDDANANCFKSLHITSTDTISLYAGNWPWYIDEKTKKKVCASFDVANILPDTTLRDQYVIQAYSPSDHDGDGDCQGSHFAIIATEDNTVVDYCLTAKTEAMHKVQRKIDAGVPETSLTDEERALLHYQIGIDTLQTPVLKAGQVYYIWTGEGAQADYDLTGSWVKARDEKKIAVFNGVPHTNIPYKVRNRDQLFEQAMPTQYWGTKFAVTASEGRYKDRLAILALNDETEVHIKYELANGSIKDSIAHVFDFASNPKHYWEFEYNTNGADYKFVSCYIETSCPCAVHQIMVSNAHDQNKEAPGDPSMAWLNPIEQVISDITFSTFQTYNHYVNIVTDSANVKYMHLLGMSSRQDSLLEKAFYPLNGNEAYSYARIQLDNNPKAYTLTGKTGFIANVYGLGSKESYSYSVGGATKPLTQFITINGQKFTPDSKNSLCDEDTVNFACHPDYEYDSIYWYFGDGTDTLLTYEQAQEDTIIPHYYKESKSYEAYVDIYRKSSNLCKGQAAVARIPFTVTIGHYQFTIGEADIPCPEDGKEYIGKIPYTNPGLVDLHGENVKIEFDQTAKDDDFKDSELVVKDGYFQISIPDNADPEKTYGIHLVITSDCGGADTTLTFSVNFDNDILIQRYDYLLGLKASFMEGHQLHDFQWYRYPDSTKVEGQTTSNLNFYDLPEGTVKPGDAFYLSFIMDNETTTRESCPKAFDSNTKAPDFGSPDQLIITATYSPRSKKVFVNADWKGKTDIECYAEWLDVSGRIWQEKKFNIPDGGCTIDVPTEGGFYILRVKTDGGSRSFKMFIND